MPNCTSLFSYVSIAPCGAHEVGLVRGASAQDAQATVEAELPLDFMVCVQFEAYVDDAPRKA